MSKRERPIAYGGQAVIEGVMMRGRRHFAVACRLSSGEILVKEEEVPAFFTRYRWANWPFLRGCFALADALVLGMKALLFSANLAMAEEQKARGGSAAEEGSGPGSADERAESGAGTVSSVAVSGSAFIGIAIGICLFVLLPSLLAGLLKPLHPSGTVKNLVEGGLRIALVLGYIALIGRMAHVRRLFQYHGAEHKAINGLEREGTADVDAAIRQSTLHPRCGTNFVLTVLLVKILVFALIGWQEAIWIRLGSRLALLPVVAAVAYEVIRLAGRYRHVRFLQLLVLPGLITQRLTTREPDREMVEVAVAALRSVVQREEAAAESREPRPATVPATAQV